MSIQGINIPFAGGDTTLINNSTTNTTNLTQSGSDVSVSFFYDFPFTGFSVGESFIPKSWNFTGFALGSSVTGSGLGISTMSGNFYERTSANVINFITGWTYETGVLWKLRSGVQISVGGQSRIGLNISGNFSGLANFTVGIFGF